MKLVDHWLRGIGLEYAIPRFHEQGITTPQKLAQLNLRDMYELGKTEVCLSLDRR